MANYLTRSAVVIRDDGGVSITRLALEDMQKYGYSNEDEFIAWYMNRVSPGKPFSLVPSSDIPTDRKDRQFWKLDGSKVIPDQAKVAEKEAKEKAKKGRLAELKGKQNFSSQEVSEILKEFVL